MRWRPRISKRKQVRGGLSRRFRRGRSRARRAAETGNGTTKNKKRSSIHHARYETHITLWLPTIMYRRIGPSAATDRLRSRSARRRVDLVERSEIDGPHAEGAREVVVRLVGDFVVVCTGSCAIVAEDGARHVALG